MKKSIPRRLVSLFFVGFGELDSQIEKFRKLKESCPAASAAVVDPVCREAQLSA